jgi:diacylglycerol kinase family enzyme
MPSFLVLTSPSAGNTGDDTLEPALDVLRAAGEVEVVSTGSPDELDAVLDRRGDRTPVVAGGDGSIHAIVAALHRRGELDVGPLGLLPLGTGNDFARSLELPVDPAEAAGVIVSGTPRPLDLIVDEDGGVVVNSVHAGAGADAAKAGRTWKERWGRIGYAIGAVRTIVAPEDIEVSVRVDGEEVCNQTRPVLQVAIGNGAYVGGGAPLTPEARPDDGQLDVLVAATRNLGSRLGYAAGLLVGRHGHRDDVTSRRGTHVEVSGEEFWCSTDGELTGPHRSRAWRLVPGAYALFVPAGDRARS